MSVDAFMNLAIAYATVVVLATRNMPRELRLLSERADLSPDAFARAVCLCVALSALLFWPVGIPLVLLLRLASAILRRATIRCRELALARSLAQARVCIRRPGARRP